MSFLSKNLKISKDQLTSHKITKESCQVTFVIKINEKVLNKSILHKQKEKNSSNKQELSTAQCHKEKEF